MPAWIPGSYMIRDFAKNIITLAARCGDTRLAIDKLDKGHRGLVTRTIAAFQDTQIATWAFAIAWTQLGEQLADCRVAAQTRKGETTLGDAVVLGHRNQRLGDPA